MSFSLSPSHTQEKKSFVAKPNVIEKIKHKMKHKLVLYYFILVHIHAVSVMLIKYLGTVDCSCM